MTLSRCSTDTSGPTRVAGSSGLPTGSASACLTNRARNSPTRRRPCGACAPPSASPRFCGSSTTTTARTRMTTSPRQGRGVTTCRGPVASACRRRTAPVGDPLTLVRIRPQQPIGRRPARVLGRGVPLQVPGTEEPAAAAVDRTAPLLPGLTRVVEAEQRVWPGLADLQAGDADQHREQALDLAEGPGDGAAEGTVRPHSVPSFLELAF